MPGRVLIADEVATNRILMKVKLSAASYKVVQADSRRGLLDCIKREMPDLIILDGRFQNDRCIDICQEIHENPASASIPLMILASDFTPADRLAALHAGACEVLTKPVDDNVFLARVRNSMRVHGIEQELHRRENTAIELGFQEAATSFQHSAQMLIVEGADVNDLSWQEAFKTENFCDVRTIGQARILDDLSHSTRCPDIILLPATTQNGGDGLSLLAELRSRAVTRHAAIVVVDGSTRNSAAITALDMGANDVIDSTIPAAEFAFRLQHLLRRKFKADRLRNSLADGLRLAMTDPLTGLFNRRYAFPHMSRIAAKSNAAGSPFAVMVLDLDRFKRINDTYGHTAGDVVLKEVAKRLSGNVRSVDLIARIGGEEFLVVMPDTDLIAAKRAAERLRRVTEATPISIPGRHRSICVTTSIGVSIGGMTGQIEATVEAMVDRADQALLGAKSTGRNQVTFEQSAA